MPLEALTFQILALDFAPILHLLRVHVEIVGVNHALQLMLSPIHTTESFVEPDSVPPSVKLVSGHIFGVQAVEV